MSRSPKIILDISQRAQFQESVKVEPCDYCGRMKGSCLCSRSFYESPQVNVSREGASSAMISPVSNNSFISIEDLNRKRRLSGEYDYEGGGGGGNVVYLPSDCVYESNAKRGRYDQVQMDPLNVANGDGESESFRKFYCGQYNGHYYQTDPPLMLKPFSGSTETDISIGGVSNGSMDCHTMGQTSPMKQGYADQHHHHLHQHHQPPPPVEAELPPIFTLCSNESAQTRVQNFKYMPSPEEQPLDLEDEYDDIKSEDSRLTSEAENVPSHQPQKRGRPRNGNKVKRKNVDKDPSSYEDLQQMRVMANVRERQRTQVNWIEMKSVGD